MQIAIIGAGYVGLTSAAVLAELGHTVWAVRKDAEKVEMLKRGEVPFYEPGLAEMVKRNVDAGRLVPTMSYAEAVPPAEVIFICVGTPSSSTGEADLSQVFAAAKEIAENWGDGYKVVVDKSTVPVGTAEKVRQIISSVISTPPKRGRNLTPSIEQRMGSFANAQDDATRRFDVASCPEFLREGSAVRDTLNPDRTVIGVDSDQARDLLLKVHEGLPGERLVTDIKTAEMIKYASNAFLATKISFINEIANLCDEVGANVDEVARGMGLDKRIGPHFLKAGLGWGGSCLPKDTRALHHIALGADYEFKVVKVAIEVNNEQRHRLVQKLRKTLGILEGKKIGVLGLAFKNNTDDVRESAALDIIVSLIKQGAKVAAYDPQAAANAKAAIPELATCATALEVADGADAVLVLTEWSEFRDLPWVKMKEQMRQPLIFDGRNLLDPKKMQEIGFTYISIGRP